MITAWRRCARGFSRRGTSYFFTGYLPFERPVPSRQPPDAQMVLATAASRPHRRRCGLKKLPVAGAADAAFFSRGHDALVYRRRFEAPVFTGTIHLTSKLASKICRRSLISARLISRRRRRGVAASASPPTFHFARRLRSSAELALGAWLFIYLARNRPEYLSDGRLSSRFRTASSAERAISPRRKMPVVKMSLG